MNSMHVTNWMELAVILFVIEGLFSPIRDIVDAFHKPEPTQPDKLEDEE